MIFFDILKDNLDYLQNDTQLNIISLYKLHEYESAGFNKNKYIIGMPGCAKSPKENGVDWIIWRILTGLKIDNKIINKMSIGGLINWKLLKIESICIIITWPEELQKFESKCMISIWICVSN